MGVVCVCVFVDWLNFYFEWIMAGWFGEDNYGERYRKKKKYFQGAKKTKF